MLEDLSQHVLDIAENSLNAGADRIEITILQDSRANRLVLEVADNGHGMDAETAVKVLDPFYTTRTTRRVGLGLPFLKQSAELCGGSLSLQSVPGKGTRLRADFALDCIDRPPLGNIPSTIVTLLAGAPGVRWIYRHVCDGRIFEFDSKEILEILGDSKLFQSAEVALWLRDYLRENIETAEKGH
ncbi:MAG: ATP-binding protein [Synergistaceae bacterium]|jgi:hypothetical protein|nr:ATP-binding protein [Synergistaceae bacterium]